MGALLLDVNGWSVTRKEVGIFNYLWILKMSVTCRISETPSTEAEQPQWLPPHELIRVIRGAISLNPGDRTRPSNRILENSKRTSNYVAWLVTKHRQHALSTPFLGLYHECPTPKRIQTIFQDGYLWWDDGPPEHLDAFRSSV